VEKEEIKNNQNTKQENEKSKNDASLDLSDPSHSMLQAVHLETHRQCRKIQRGTYRNEVNKTETKTTDENLDPMPAPFAMHPIKPRQTIFFLAKHMYDRPESKLLCLPCHCSKSFVTCQPSRPSALKNSALHTSNFVVSV
jgi:hypothetical protein